jgi:hypothetical protein
MRGLSLIARSSTTDMGCPVLATAMLRPTRAGRGVLAATNKSAVPMSLRMPLPGVMFLPSGMFVPSVCWDWIGFVQWIAFVVRVRKTRVAFPAIEASECAKTN